MEQTVGRNRDPYLSLDELAALAGVHRATVYRWIADPALKLRDLVIRLPGGRIRIQESQFRGWLESQNHRPTRPERSAP